MQISYWEGTKTHGWRVTDWMCRGLTWPLYTFKPNQRLHNWHLHNSTLLADQFMLLCFNPNDHSCKYNSWHLHRAARGLLFLRSHLQHILKTCTSTKKVFKRYSILIIAIPKHRINCLPMLWHHQLTKSPYCALSYVKNWTFNNTCIAETPGNPISRMGLWIARCMPIK